jgi:hypothetical protein
LAARRDLRGRAADAVRSSGRDFETAEPLNAMIESAEEVRLNATGKAEGAQPHSCSREEP